MAEKYPDTFPTPLVEPYNWDVDMGVLRTPMDGGFSKQRRLYYVMPHQWQLTYMLPMAKLFSWQNWVNLYAYEYFEAQLASHLQASK